MTKPEDILKEIEAARVFLENEARVSQDVLAMQNAMETCLGYAERISSLQAEVMEYISIRSNELMDEYLLKEDVTDFVKKTKITAAIAPEVKLEKILGAVNRRLRDSKWLLLQAISMRKIELQKLM